MRKLLTAVIVLLCCGVAFPARKHPPKPPLKVTKIVPRHSRTYVPISEAPRVTFSRAVDTASVTPATVEIRRLSGEAVAAAYSFDAKGRTVTLTPLRLLESGTDYQVIVRAGVLPLKGKALRREKHSYFFTALDTTTIPLIRKEQFTQVATPMTEPRGGQRATRLADGRILLAAGMTDYTTFATSADLFSPMADTFVAAGSQLVSPRQGHAGVRYGTNALLVGGSNAFGPLATTELFDTISATFHAGPPLNEARDFTAAVTLTDGRIFVVGGLSYVNGKPVYSATAEILDPGASAFRLTPAPPMTPRAGATATVLPDGRVLILGGDSQSLSVSAEYFDPATEGFQKVPGSPVWRRQGHSATVLGTTGLVLLADGGERTPQVFDPGNGAFIPSPALFTIDRIGATASLLPDGNVMLIGGLATFAGTGIVLDSIELYVAKSPGSVYRSSVTMAEPRFGHTATTLDDGRVLIAGGFGAGSPASLASGVLFTPDPPEEK